MLVAEIRRKLPSLEDADAPDALKQIRGLENLEADVQPMTLKGIVLPRNNEIASAADRFLKTDVGRQPTHHVPTNGSK